jgi:hypothetical protein
LVVILASAALAGCGLYVPNKHLSHADRPYIDKTNQELYQNIEGRAEANIIANIRCEIQNGIYVAAAVRHNGQPNVTYLKDNWGTQVTLKLTWDEQSSLSPGLSFIHPLKSSQTRTIGLGGSASAHATRVETVTFIFSNLDLWNSEVADLNAQAPDKRALEDCRKGETGTMIDSDLKIADFIVDKATIASTGIASTEEASNPPFSTFQEDLTFVGAYSANFTPTWKLTRFANNSSRNLVAGTRTVTGDVLITLGPLAPATGPAPSRRQLAEPAASQHTAAFGGGATASQVLSQGH